MPVPALTFLAPPSFDDEHEVDAAPHVPGWPDSPSRHATHPGAAERRPAGALRMTPGARAAAAGMKVTDADVRRCLDAPEDVSSDPQTPSRTRLQRGSLVILVGADGTVLRVNRQRR